MNNEELKKVINYQYQLATFAITMYEEVKSNDEWRMHAEDLMASSLRMIRSIKGAMEAKEGNAT
jgi:hypothetical protein